MAFDQIAQLIPGFDFGWVLVYLRIQACILALPAFGERMVGVRVKVALAMALTPLMAELATFSADFSSAWKIFAIALPELAVGFTTGFVVRILALAISMAATAIAMTASLSQLIGGMEDAAPHPIGRVFQLGGLALLFALGLPSFIVDLIADSFSVWPSGALPQIDTLAPEIAGLVARSFNLALILAAPFILGGFLFQALSGVINKVMPALPVVFIGAPAAIMLALLALALLGPTIIRMWTDVMLSVTLPGGS